MPDMICPTCGRAMPGDACPTCAAVASPADAAKKPWPYPHEPGPGLGWGDLVSVVVVLTTLVLVGWCLFAPAILKIRDAQARVQAINNMKQVAQACHNFHDSKKHLPTPTMIVRKDGETREVALSWRFSILPFIDSNTLYSEFDRTVGWDHPNNARFQTMEIWVYALPHRDPDPAGQTRIQYFTGAGTLFPSNAPIKLTDIKDGTPNTLLLAEADEAVVWTRRADMAIRPNLELPLPAGGFYAGFADGTVRWISREATSDEILRQLIHPSDGKPDGDWDR